MAVTGETQGRALLRRMDRLPGWPLPRSDFAVLGVAYFFVFYDISDIAFAMPAVAKQYELSDNAVKFAPWRSACSATSWARTSSAPCRTRGVGGWLS